MTTLNKQRRDFLKKFMIAGAGTTLAQHPLSQFTNIDLLGSAHAAPVTSTYKALVCILLDGGNDSANMLIPTSTAEYNQYQSLRLNLAIDKADILPLAHSDTSRGQYGIHPKLAGLKSLYDGGKLSFIANTGPLVKPVTKQAFLDKSVTLPPHLFSHNDQKSHWQSANPLSKDKTGWSGRLADKLDLADDALASNINIGGHNIWQKGETTLPYGMQRTITKADGSVSGGASRYSGLNKQYRTHRERRATLDKIIAQSNQQVFMEEYGRLHSRSMNLADTVSDALSALQNSSPINTSFPAENRLGEQLKTVARMIQAQGDFNASQQTFFVRLGGFDTHADQNEQQPILFEKFDAALVAFQAALEEIGMDDNVLTFTMSDFGRTLTSNGDGTDHGWGGHQIVMGNTALIKGGDIHGTMPDLDLNGNDSVKKGRFIPRYAADQYAATLVNWYGLPSGLTENQLFPNLSNFSTTHLDFLA